MKDNFSTASDQYAQFRPGYPPALYTWLFERVKEKNCAWDCGTGNGQVAIELAKKFYRVEATDISANQLQQAFRHKKIHYSVQPAENTCFPNHFFNLIVVAQAIHWFDFEKFYAEVRRTLKPDGLLVVLGYSRPKVNDEIDALVDDFYHNTIGAYWDKERKYIDEHYRTIPFPFNEIPAPQLAGNYNWTLEHFTGYLGTWSAVKHFAQARGYNPVEKLKPALEKAWGSQETISVCFPVLIRAGTLLTAGDKPA